MRAVDPLDLATLPRALGKRVQKSTRRDDYIYLMYEYRQMEGRRYGKIMVVQNQTRLEAKAPIGTVLN